MPLSSLTLSYLSPPLSFPSPQSENCSPHVLRRGLRCKPVRHDRGHDMQRLIHKPHRVNQNNDGVEEGVRGTQRKEWCENENGLEG